MEARLITYKIVWRSTPRGLAPDVDVPEPKVELEGADLRAAVMPRDLTTIEGGGRSGAVALDGADLRGADFRGARLAGVSFWRANLRGARFDDAYLNGAMFPAACLSGATLSTPKTLASWPDLISAAPPAAESTLRTPRSIVRCSLARH